MCSYLVEKSMTSREMVLRPLPHQMESARANGHGSPVGSLREPHIDRLRPGGSVPEQNLHFICMPRNVNLKAGKRVE